MCVCVCVYVCVCISLCDIAGCIVLFILCNVRVYNHVHINLQFLCSHDVYGVHFKEMLTCHAYIIHTFANRLLRILCVIRTVVHASSVLFVCSHTYTPVAVCVCYVAFCYLSHSCRRQCVYVLMAPLQPPTGTGWSAHNS